MERPVESSRRLSALACLCVLTPLTPGVAREGDEVCERRVLAMGTMLSLEVAHASRPLALQASERAVRAIEAAEARLSTWIPDSELSRLNRSPVGEPFALSSELAGELERCEALWRETGGAFDPGVGALLDAWGVRTGGAVPSSDELDALRSHGLADLVRDGRVARRTQASLRLDAGAFGKGRGLDLALDALAAAGAHGAVLDFGGQVALLPNGSPRSFAIAHPRERDRGEIEITIRTGSFATSATSEHGRHILNPRTARPAPDFGSATVWSSSALRADALSTALYVMGPEAALAWARDHDDVELLVLDDTDGTLRARATSGLRDRLHALAADVTLAFESDRGEKD